MSMPQLRIGGLVARLPIVQGGMGVRISLSGLAAAVANAGGIGVISSAGIGLPEKDVRTNFVEANARALSHEILKAKQATNGVIGVNIMVVLTNYASLVETSLKAGADIIFSGAGLPLALPGIVQALQEREQKTFHTSLAPIVSSGRAAKIIAKKWLSAYNYCPDAFVLEGPKAGGHLGFKREDVDDKAFALENLLQEMVESVKEFEDKAGRPIPVIAAGGVTSGQEVKRLLEMGASGVQMGSRFVTTHECDADIRFKEAYLNASPEDITIINSPVGLPGRAIKNDFIREVEQQRPAFRCIYHCIKTCNAQNSPYCIANALYNASLGDMKSGFAFCGTNISSCSELHSVHDVMNSIEKEYSE